MVGGAPSGKRSIVFARPKGAFLEVTLPCGQCIGCRLERSRQWAMRCMHEASLHERNCFVTLTYDDAHLPPGGSIDPRAFVLFMKRLRRRTGERIRYYHAAEYGEITSRPHHHCCLFGYDFRDKTPWTTRGGFPVWRSALLEEVWPLGLCEVGSVTFESAAYVARYIMKKQLGRRYVQKAAEDSRSVAPQVVDRATGEIVRAGEYATMSRRPGIGAEWFRRFGSEVYPADSVIVNGKEVKPPRYYDLQFEIVDPEGFEKVRRARREARKLEDETAERLVVREVVAKAKVNLFGRGEI